MYGIEIKDVILLVAGFLLGLVPTLMAFIVPIYRKSQKKKRLEKRKALLHPKSVSDWLL